MYIAIKHIGRQYIPGDILPDDLPAETAAWLIEAGAIRKAAPSPIAPEIAAEPAENITEASQEDEADEFDDEALEIDVMAGIVKDTEKPAPAKKPRATSAGKKAPKGGKTK